MRIAKLLVVLVVSAIIPIMATADPFQLEFSLTIPGLNGAIMQVKFNDLDNDGTPEVLATDGRTVVLYSAVSDSIVFNLTTDDTAYLSGVLFDDVNRDKVPDIVVATDFLSCATIDAYDGASRYQSKKSASYPRSYSAIDGCSSGHDLMYTADVDDDGHLELLVSVENIKGYGSFDWEWTSGYAHLYYTFPDSLIWTKDEYFDIARSSPIGESHANQWLRSSACNYWSHGGNTSRSQTLQVYFLDEQRNTIVPAIPPLPACSGAVEWQYNFHDLASVRPEFAPDSGTTLLTTATSIYHCSGDSSDSRLSSLNLFRVFSPTAISLVWSKNLGRMHYDDFHFPSPDRGYFLAFRGDSLVMFREGDGSIRSSTLVSPTGQRSWERPFADNAERLVTLNSQTVSIYRFDIASEIEESDQDASLPASFTLHGPYPNPFNSELSIPVSFPHTTQFRIAVYNLLGQQSALLFDGSSTGSEMIFRWDAARVSSGVYFIRASSETVHHSAKVILLK